MIKLPAGPVAGVDAAELMYGWVAGTKFSMSPGPVEMYACKHKGGKGPVHPSVMITIPPFPPFISGKYFPAMLSAGSCPGCILLDSTSFDADLWRMHARVQHTPSSIRSFICSVVHQHSADVVGIRKVIMYHKNIE